MDRLLSGLARRFVPGARGVDRRLQGCDGRFCSSRRMLRGPVDQLSQFALLRSEMLICDVCNFQLCI
ncbi:hypothetical protein AYM40_34595 [Paraburkholderia phytofirmans OLGA172]|uniref:Uncharacterized protein n=1 Tax=Paraburkholderia phytofirmans OLGA172 TaxID=1417228 RepID=A0A160FVZ9_9BURK|nr:hypothetical protein AYM40_34595 [Paraburkholderia phytofirmans OLGA172]